MGAWWEANTGPVFSLSPSLSLSCWLFNSYKNTIEFLTAKKIYKTCFPNLLSVIFCNFSSNEIYSQRQFFKCRGTNFYEMNLPEHIILSQPFVLLDSTFPYIYWSFFSPSWKDGRGLEESGQKDKDDRIERKSGTKEWWKKRERYYRDKIRVIKWGKLNSTWFYTICL